ncbi:MAG TPA: hypothetical protein VF658_21640 [Pyrinomonadaceae bacterium]|jgi:hypothetical protein
MKNIVRCAISLLLVLLVIGLSMPLAPYSAAASSNVPSAAPKKVKDAKVKKGPEVAARVRQLKETNENVRAALRYFEKKGRPSKIDDSFAITGKYTYSNKATALNRWGGFNSLGSFIRPASFTQQESSIGDAYVELIFVPNYDIENEWQGTVIGNRYDDYGNLVEQYVSESVMVTPDPNTYSWDEIYEAPVYGGEVQPAIDEPGMYTDYSWGETREQQPQEYMYMTKSNKAGAHDGMSIVKAGLQSRRARIRAWARCSFAWCGGAAVGCIAVNLWNAELLAGPCFAVGCITSAIGCTWGTLWQ